MEGQRLPSVPATQILKENTGERACELRGVRSSKLQRDSAYSTTTPLILWANRRGPVGNWVRGPENRRFRRSGSGQKGTG
eukprot:1446878-Rhodomonas_salina.2